MFEKKKLKITLSIVGFDPRFFTLWSRHATTELPKNHTIQRVDLHLNLAGGRILYVKSIFALKYVLQVRTLSPSAE